MNIPDSIFEGIYNVEEYFQIGTGVFIFIIAILIVPFNPDTLYVSLDNIPIEVAFLFGSLPFIWAASGVLRALGSAGSVLKDSGINRLEAIIKNSDGNNQIQQSKSGEERDSGEEKNKSIENDLV